MIIDMEDVGKWYTRYRFPILKDKHSCLTFCQVMNKFYEENIELKQLLEEIRHEITCIDGLNVFGAHYIRLGYVEVMEDDFTRLDYTELLKKIDKVIK